MQRKLGGKADRLAVDCQCARQFKPWSPNFGVTRIEFDASLELQVLVFCIHSTHLGQWNSFEERRIRLETARATSLVDAAD